MDILQEWLKPHGFRFLFISLILSQAGVHLHVHLASLTLSVISWFAATQRFGRDQKLQPIGYLLSAAAYLICDTLWRHCWKSFPTARTMPLLFIELGFTVLVYLNGSHLYKNIERQEAAPQE